MVDEVERAPSGRVTTVVERVSHEGSTWVGTAMTKGGEGDCRERGMIKTVGAVFEESVG